MLGWWEHFVGLGLFHVFTANKMPVMAPNKNALTGHGQQAVLALLSLADFYNLVNTHVGWTPLY